MTPRVLAALVGVPVLLAAAPALAATDRIRGTIEKVTPSGLVIDQRDGGTITVATTGATKYASVVPSSLDAIRKNDFIGTAPKGPKNFMVALELVIFPNSMRGAGEGQYGWDQLPDTTMRHASSSTTSSTMTNGSVAAASPVGAGRTNTRMTTGTVAAGHGGAAGRTITVTYDGGQSSTILVPPTATIVRFEPGAASLAETGAKVFIKADGAANPPTAQFVAVGKGITPPM